MINLNLRVRRAVAQDHHQIASLVFHESNTHRHLDWRSALDWVGARNFWVLDDHGTIAAAFACPEDPPNVAWIRLFSHVAHLTGPEAWSVLWKAAQADIAESNPNATVAAIIVKDWFQPLLISSGFVSKQDIVLLRRTSGDDAPTPTTALSGIQIRPMRDEDLPAVTRADLSAFGPFWHNSQDSLQRAYSQAIHATVAEDASGIIGYQISTGNPFGAHLARLAVSPQAQGRGVGSALVSELIERLKTHTSGNLSVNTQADNHASLALYKKFGFTRTGEFFPVFSFSQADN